MGRRYRNIIFVRNRKLSGKEAGKQMTLAGWRASIIVLPEPILVKLAVALDVSFRRRKLRGGGKYQMSLRGRNSFSNGRLSSTVIEL